jgi:cephalosporin hydroxylase
MNRDRVTNELKTLRRLLYQGIFDRVVYRSATQNELIEDFHRLYYDSHLFGGTWQDTHWLGIKVTKCPLDLWILQEILSETRPDLLVETGTAYGGSALFYASIFDALGNGRVVTIDVSSSSRQRPEHPRIDYLRGSSVSPEILERVQDAARSAERVMVTLDSDHTKAHVLAELQEYSGFVTKGNYLVVEDTNVNGHPVEPDFGPGPMEALEEFLQNDRNFVIDEEKEKFYLTFNPRGYLRRVL